MIIERKNDSDSSPRPDAEDLRVAFTENWLQVRHVDSQRFLLLNLELVVTAGVGSLIATSEGLRQSEASLCLLFLVLAIFSLMVYVALLKLSSDMATHYRAVQWVSERMGLIEAYGGGVAKQAMFRGFVGLPLPLKVEGLPISMTAVFAILPAFITASTVGLCVYYLACVNTLRLLPGILGDEWTSILVLWTRVNLATFSFLLVLWVTLPRGPIDKWFYSKREDILTQRKPLGLQVCHPDELRDAVEEQQKSKSIVAGILALTNAVLCAGGVVLLIVAMVSIARGSYGATHETDLICVLAVAAVLLLAGAICALIGGIIALRRRAWYLALLMTIMPGLAVPFVGPMAFFLMAIAHDEFAQKHAPARNLN